MSGFKTGTFLSLVLALVIAGCGGGSDGVTKSVAPPPNVAGTYLGGWTLQVLRKSDGFKKEFQCQGAVALQQAGTSSSTAVLSGWDTAGLPCAPQSWDLEGVVRANGEVEFSSDAPAPPEGPCPGGHGVSFSGLVTVSNSGAGSLSVRGVTEVACPQFGEHRFTYIIEAWRR